MFWYYENRNQAVRMHLEHSVHNRPMEKIEKNDTGGVPEENEYIWLDRVLRGDLKIVLGREGGGGLLLFLLSSTKKGEGAQLFLFPFFITSMQDSFFQS